MKCCAIKNIEATRELKVNLNGRKGASVVSGVALDTEGLAEAVQKLSRCKEDRTAGWRRKICSSGRKIGSQCLEDDEA